MSAGSINAADIKSRSLEVAINSVFNIGMLSIIFDKFYKEKKIEQKFKGDLILLNEATIVVASELVQGQD